MLTTLFDKNLAETFSYWATALGIIVALTATLAAYWRYRADQKTREWDRARQSYSSFLDIAIAHPEFYPGSWTEKADKDPVWRNQYRWFIAKFLWASEEIVVAMPLGDEAWSEAIRVFVREHCDFFWSPEGAVEMACYYTPLKSLVQQALAEAETSRPEAKSHP